MSYKYTRYHVTGSNLFGQWCGCSDRIIQEFTINKHPDNTCLGNSVGRLVHIGWSHNIYDCNGFFYITGDYKLSGQTIETLELPQNCRPSSDLAIVSDDFHLIVVDTYRHAMLSLDLETKNVKLFSLPSPIEVPLTNKSKKFKSNVHIVRCVAANNMVVYLKEDGSVYSGVPPGEVETSHCEGSPVDVQCGLEHCVMLTDAGKLYTWGEGRRLQLGHGDTRSVHTPTLVTAVQHIDMKQIAAGGWHTMALSRTGDLYVWGWNECGQLGIPQQELTSLGEPTWAPVCREDGARETTSIVDMACGTRHSALLLADSTVWTCGDNKYGQLGFPLDSHRTIHRFQKNRSFKNGQRVMCGQWSTVVLCQERE